MLVKKHGRVVVKQKLKTLASIVDENYDPRTSVGCYEEDFPGCCGAFILHDIHQTVSAKNQARKLARIFDTYSVGLIIICDTTSNNYWAATKAIADKSTTVNNPNSGNKIASWTITRAMVPKIYYFDETSKIKKK